jgi:sugar (glycoside-pentoside-hexuronide) transporter
MNPVTFRKRLGYAASDTAGQLVFCVISNYLLYFYTDVYGLAASTAGTILLIARFSDAIDTPIWGIIFDKTRSRWGKSRPWFLWLCLPFATFGALTFLTPNLAHTAKIWYAAGTYVACGILYTGINTPVTSILSALTPDPRERVSLTCYRMVGSKLGVLLVNLTALRLVGWLGQGDDKKGFMLTMPVFAAGSVLLFLFAFRNLEEVVKDKSKPPVRSTFGAIRGNWPWIILFSSFLLFWIAFTSRMFMVPYFFEYVLHRKDLIWVVNSLDFISLATVFCLPWLCRWTCKCHVLMIGLVGMALGQGIVFIGAHGFPSLPVIFAGWIVGFLASGMAIAMPFSMLSDTVDYGEWKTGVRAAGLLTAIGAAFCTKAGSGIGGALPAWVLAACGYVPNAAQSPASLAGIEIGFIWIPTVFFALSAIPILFYRKYEMLEPRIHADLERRRAGAVPVAVVS